MSNVNLVCPYCNNQIVVPETLAGHQAVCPYCNNTISVPAGNYVPAANTLSSKKKLYAIIGAVVIAAIVAIVCFCCNWSDSSSGSSSGSSSRISSSKLKQSSKNALIKSYITAIVNKDVDTIWQLSSPELQRRTIEGRGGKKGAMEYLQKMVNDIPEGNLAYLKEVLKYDKQKFSELVDKCDNEFKPVNINGKWYLGNYK